MKQVVFALIGVLAVIIAGNQLALLITNHDLWIKIIYPQHGNSQIEIVNILDDKASGIGHFILIRTASKLLGWASKGC